ncbi:MAG: peptidase U32 family protein, partial [Gordonibacter urolithinfaciens]
MSNQQGIGTSPVELLAPAGGAEALHAAVAGGADAVYLGLDAFNARRNADNFTLETLGEACDYAHLRGVRVYVTLNTAILPSEVDRALECARQAYRAGADAFIVQDVGVAAELSRSLPQARLHISTQMNTHNAAGIEAAAKLGARRVTLARELSLAEVEHLAGVASGLGMEVEAFAHGALCVCYSGQCFMSSMIGGRSANRGLCAQACRLPYELRNRAQRKELPSPGEHLLSPQDLCAIDLMPELVAAGAASLKIEGRMKSADYVFAVTSAYRAVLDRVLAARATGEAAENDPVRATGDERRALEEAFSRGFTTAYLTGQRGNDIMSYGRPNNRGVFVGRVAYARDGVAAIAAEEELHEGDVLEFWTNKGHFAHTLGPLEADKAGNVRTAPQRAVGKGDRVFRVRNAATGFADDPLAPRVRVVGSARRQR